MIIRENTLKLEDVSEELMIRHDKMEYLPEDIIFFDLEHYVYKKPKCIGVFGASIYDKDSKTIQVTQYMIENRYEAIDILHLAKNYFIKMKEAGKKAIVTFSGNNDFTVINYLFEKYGIGYDFKEEFDSVDIQKEYEREKGTSIGLKKLEKQFGIIRESELISGSNLAKTFHKVMKDREYIKRMPKEKVEKILLYNEQDVVNLYHIYVNWKQFIYVEEDIIEESDINDIKSIEDIEGIEDEVIREVEIDVIDEVAKSIEELDEYQNKIEEKHSS
ncbi:ribonuclease H-like domain-containing protein [Clostridium sp. LP20]|uniref:ribonuclease H-like domain-containing protein n=1 Tax=Clostridium sp. LP20 TaxID=3418665 RepID=UPI003EE6EBD7